MPQLPGPDWTPEQADKIQAWLNEKWGPTRKCAQCDASMWSVIQPVTLTLATDAGKARFDLGFPCIAVACGNCGNLVLVHAIQAGIIEGEWEPPARA